eukprot:3432689-Alexandrium_andersonii.AAC.1
MRPPSTEAHWRPPSEPPQNGRRAMGESAPTELLGAPPRGAPGRCVRASSPIPRVPKFRGRKWRHKEWQLFELLV